MTTAPSTSALDARIDGIVGGRTASALEKAFGILSVRDLLWHLPRRYSERGELTPLTGLPIGEHITVLAQVLDVRSRRMQRGGTLLEVRITDGIGHLKLTFFNQAWRAGPNGPGGQLIAGARGIFAGKVSVYRGELQLQHPDYELFEQRDESQREIGDSKYEISGPQLTPERDRSLDEAAARAFAERPVPIYPATSKVATWTIQRAMAIVLKAVLGTGAIVDPLPLPIKTEAGAIALEPALELVHQPQNRDDYRRARASLRFREAFELQLSLLDRRRRTEQQVGAPRPAGGELLRRFDSQLPFELTGDQRRVGEVISGELAEPHPMHRLLQGEVGSGKTLVAVRAMLQVAQGGGQSAMLVPTEVLAMQHYRSIIEALGPQLSAELNPVLLTGSMPTAERKRALLSLASGNARISVGTHALLSQPVSFYDLGLVVVDEQHRFGVDQREALRAKGTNPHVLAMTATPIPRTVALTAFGDLEVSTIRELPPGRQGIETFAVPETEMPARAARVWARIGEDVAAGRQVYIVCPAISPGGDLEEGLEGEPLELDEPQRQPGLGRETAQAQRPLANVEETVAELRAMPGLSGARIEGLSGAMPPAEKDRIMSAFAAGEVQVLVATTVIEVGVNVPNATIMVVRDADRFGISQLHQLRGRVGRGDHAGLCLLMTQAPQGSLARERIDAVAATSDGFELAEVDLRLRREGDILGTAQSGGRSTLRLLRVAEHGELIERARAMAVTLLEQDPGLESAPLLAAQLAEETRQRNLENLAKS